MSARVLVVDDEPQFLRALATNLRGAGYEVETAATAAEALSAAALHPPDAVVLDLLLPDGSGTRRLPRAAHVERRADRRRLGGRRRGREDRGARRRRRRLRDEAVRDGRAARASARGPAARRRRRASRCSSSGRSASTWKSSRHRQRQAGAPDAARVPHPARARPEPRQAPDAPRDPARGLGPRLRRRVELPARLRLAAAQEAGGRPGNARACC